MLEKLLVLLIMALLGTFPSNVVWADESLKNLTQRVQPTTVPLGSPDTHVLSFEDRDPGSSTFAHVFIWIRLGNSASWAVRKIDRTVSFAALFAQDQPDNYEVSVQGSYFGTNQDHTRFYPLGLVIADGIQLSKLKTWKDGGVLSMKDGLTSITPIRSVPTSFSADQAFQSKPLIIEHGANAMRRPDATRFNRAAIGIARDGSLVVAGVFSPNNDGATLNEFADALMFASRIDNDPLITAMTTDGGPGAHIFIRPLRRSYGYEGTTFVPNVLDFRIHPSQRH